MKGLLIVSAILVAVSCLTGLTGSPFTFIVSVAITSYVLLFLVLRLLLAPLYRFLKIKAGKKVMIAAVVIIVIFISSALVLKFTRSAVEFSSTESLKSLPYSTWVSAEDTIEKLGVVKHERGGCFEGLNIYASGVVPEVYLMDMVGNILHTWSLKLDKGKESGARPVEMCENGDILTFHGDKASPNRFFVRLDWDSNIEWIKEIRGHHDIAVAENGDIYILAMKDEVVFLSFLPVPILNNYIVLLSSDGEEKGRMSLYRILEEEIPLSAVGRIYWWIINPRNLWEVIKQKAKGHFELKINQPFDVFHANTVEIIDRDIQGVCKKGNLLISVRELDLIGIVDTNKEELVWSWGPRNLRRQHQPTVLDNGNILIFDNGSKGRRYSRIVELDPVKKRVVWEYKYAPPHKFFSAERGSSQRLPNGNTLITNSDSGHVFEVTDKGEIVWEFYNPEINEEHRTRAAIYRMMRIIDPGKYPRLKRLKWN